MNATEVIRRSRTAGVCLAALLAWTGARAQEGAPRQPIPHSAGERPGQIGHQKTVAGVVKRFTTDDRGDINGMVLDNGTIVRWWPHLGKRFLAMVSKGDSVRVTGQVATPERGVSALMAETITNLKTNVKRLNDDTPPPPVAALSKTAVGRVVKYTTTSIGRIDGLVMSDGTVVHWPLALEKRFTSILARGNEIEASGPLKTTPRGDTFLMARVIKNRSNGLVATTAGSASVLVVPSAPAPVEAATTVVRPVPPPPPAAERPVARRPVVEAPVAKPPVVETPVVKRPVVESPVAHTTTDVERRLRDLQDKVDRLMKEVESLRRDRQQQ